MTEHLVDKRTGYCEHPLFKEHDTGGSHPERAARLVAIEQRLETSGVFGELDRRTPSDGLGARGLGRIHRADYLNSVPERIASGDAALDWGDTVVSPASDRAARLAARSVVEAVDRVMAGTWSNAFCAVRPPGHHAEPDRAMGFCLYNNVAVAAAHLRAEHGIERVAIVDFDVHHGNGTQHAFERSAEVFFASLHQFPHYPGTGADRERGLGAGDGATLNLPQDAGAGDLEWLSAFEDQLLPALDDFAPQFVLVSAGFDAHADDPLADTRLSDDAYATMTKGLLDLAARHAQGRLVSSLEGGYELDALGRCVERHLMELIEAAKV